MASHNRKLKPAIFADIETRNHAFVGVTWMVAGSKDNVYEIDMLNDGFLCTCPAFAFRKNCKHITQVGNQIVGE